MNGLGELIPLSLGISISPIPVAGLLLMLLSPGGILRGVGFATGWWIGVAFATVGLFALSLLLPAADTSSWLTIDPIVTLVIGLLLVAGALVQVIRRRRREPSETDGLPGWILALERLGPIRAGAVGFGYAAFRPKNLAISIAASVIIHRTAPDVGSAAVALVIFTTAASITMILPILALVVGGSSVRAGLDATRTWLVGNIGSITSFTIGLIGLALVVLGLVRLTV